MSHTTVAVLGVGTMGAGMARSLLREGFRVKVWNRSPEKMEPLTEAGAAPAGSIADAVQNADCIITMLFDAAGVRQVADEITAQAPQGTVWLQCSTVGQEAMVELAQHVSDSVRLVDAPVLGTKQPAESGKLVVLASGPADAIETAMPVIDAIGNRLVMVGDAVGQASALKLVCNSWLATLTAGAAQSLALAESLGLDPKLFLEAIQGGSQDAPYLQRKGAQMIDRDFSTGFSVAAALKDVHLAREASISSGVPTELMDALGSLLHRAAETGDSDDDIGAIRRAFDAQAG